MELLGAGVIIDWLPRKLNVKSMYKLDNGLDQRFKFIFYWIFRWIAKNISYDGVEIGPIPSISTLLKYQFSWSNIHGRQFENNQSVIHHFRIMLAWKTKQKKKTNKTNKPKIFKSIQQGRDQISTRSSDWKGKKTSERYRLVFLF